MNDLFFSILSSSFYGAIAGGIILLVRWITRTWWRSKWHAVLWIILLIKLLIPDGPYCFVSAYRMVPEIPAELVFELPDQSNSQVSQQPEETVPTQNTVSYTETIPPRPSFRAAAILWACGSVVLASWYIWVSFRFYRNVRRCRRTPVPQALSSMLEHCHRQVGLRRPVKLVVTAEASSPCVYGWFCPTILIPPDVIPLGAAQQEHLLIHELCHCKRWDPLILFATTVLQCLHWFNPVLWGCFRVLRQDLELAADEMAITCLGPGHAAAYGRSLLSVAACCTGKSSFIPPAMGMAEKKSQLEIRIRRICMDHHWKKHGILATGLAVCCVLVLAVILLTSGDSTPDAGDTPPSPPVANEPESPQEPTQQEPIPVVIQSTFGFADQDGRMTADNFPNIPGSLYTLQEDAAVPNETYYLVDSQQFDLRAFLPVDKGDHTPADSTLISQLEADAQRTVQDSWLLGTAAPETSIYLVLFTPEGSDLLASIVVQTPNGLLRHDYPAVLNGSSAWRVDDSGTMDPDLFQILFAAQADDELLLGLTWLGAEGQSAILLKQDGQTLTELDILFYRYTAIA